jgi:hypothetical protein
MSIGTKEVLLQAAEELEGLGYTQAESNEKRGPRQYHLVSEHPRSRNEEHFRLIWESED